MEDRPDDPALTPDAPRPRRAPPTIDLEASDVTEQTAGAGGDSTASGERTSDHATSGPGVSRPVSAAIRPFLVAGLTGAATAAVVIAVAWIVGGPRETAQPKAEVNAAAIDALTSRVSELEDLAKKPAAPVTDPVQAGRLDVLEKAVVALRTEITRTLARADKLASDLDAVKSAPPPAAAADAPDLTAIKERLAQVERTARAESDKIAQAAAKPVDDTALRRLVVASMLDISARQGEPLTEALAAAKALAPDPQALQPLSDFASSGVPSPASLSRELLTLIPKLEPPAPGNATTGGGIVDRLQAGAAKLVRIERTNAAGTDRGAIVARVTTAALRNDVAEARRELLSLTPADRAPAQAWLDKVATRDAALTAAHRFAAEAMAALAKPAP